MSGSTDVLDKQLDFYIGNQASLLEQYNGRVLLIHDEQVIDAYDSKAAAYVAGNARFAPGTFLLIRCTPGNSEYTANYRSVNPFSRLASA